MARYTNPKNNEVITSELTDVRACEIVEESRNGFGIKMASNLRRFGRLSEAQRFWLHKIANECISPSPANDGEHIDDDAYATIKGLFDRAGRNVRWPKLHISYEGLDLVLSVAGARSRNPGAINIASPGRYGENTFYGRLKDNSVFDKSRATSDSDAETIAAMLLGLSDNAEKFARTHGHRTGSCCFCGRTLDHPNSVEVGYGPVCADNWGMPHTYSRTTAA